MPELRLDERLLVALSRRWRASPASASQSAQATPHVRPLSTDEVSQTMAEHGDAIERCFERDEPASRFGVALFDRDGGVRDVHLEGHHSAALGRCLSDQLTRWRFRATAAGTRLAFALVVR